MENLNLHLEQRFDNGCLKNRIVGEHGRQIQNIDGTACFPYEDDTKATTVLKEHL